MREYSCIPRVVSKRLMASAAELRKIALIVREIS